MERLQASIISKTPPRQYICLSISIYAHRSGKPGLSLWFFGDNPTALEIQFAKGTIPSDDTGWTALGLDTESPMIHTINETAPTTYIYRARYVGKNLKYGPYGDPAECTVSV